MALELGSTVRLNAWVQAVSLSNDGKTTLYHLVFKVDESATVGTVVVNDAQLEALTRGA